MSVFNPTTISLWLPLLCVAGVLLSTVWVPLSPRVRLLLKLGLVGLGLRYWYWRTTMTLPSGGGWAALLGWGLYGCELLVWLSLLVDTVQTLGGPNRWLRQLGDRYAVALREAAAPPSVDLFILVEQQPECRVRRAIMACQSLRYGRQRIYVLDLDDREPMRSLVETLGGTYVAAPVPEWSVAALLNLALRQSEGDLIAVLPAAMLPLPQFLERTVGWFSQSAIAWVQAPLPGVSADRQVHCESAYVVRRSRLEMVGGYFTAGVLPGYQTLLRLVLHGEVWVSLRETLLVSDQPESPTQGLSRRLQWLQGNWEIQQQPLAFPLSSRLDWPQRLGLANQWLYCWQPLWQLLGWVVPIVALISGIMPWSSGAGQGLAWAAYFLPFWALGRCLPGGFSQGPRGWVGLRDWRSSVVSALLCGPGLQRLGQLVMVGLLPGRRGAGLGDWRSGASGFDGALAWTGSATPSWRAYALRQRWIWFGLGWLLLSLGAIGWDLLAHPGAWVGRWPLHLWAGYNAVILVLALRSLREVGDGSAVMAQPLHLPCRFLVAGEKWPGRTLELSEQGARIQLLPHAFPLEALPEVLTIEFGRPLLQLEGRVVETRYDRGQREIQVAFQSLTLDQQRHLLWLLYAPDQAAMAGAVTPWAASQR